MRFATAQGFTDNTVNVREEVTGCGAIRSAASCEEYQRTAYKKGERYEKRYIHYAPQHRFG